MVAQHSHRCGTASELAFLDHLSNTHAGTTVLRAGWPDYLLRRPDGTHIGVEVKAHDDRVSKRQADCFAMLEAIGLAVFVWNPAKPDELTPWREYRPCQPKRPARKPRIATPAPEPTALQVGSLRELMTKCIEAGASGRRTQSLPRMTIQPRQQCHATRPMRKASLSLSFKLR